MAIAQTVIPFDSQGDIVAGHRVRWVIFYVGSNSLDTFYILPCCDIPIILTPLPCAVSLFYN